MKKKYFFLFISCLFSGFSFSQTNEKKAVNAIENTVNIADESDTEFLVATSKVTVFKKNKLPKNTKAEPTVFYIIDDKPVEYKTYILYMLDKKNKK